MDFIKRCHESLTAMSKKFAAHCDHYLYVRKILHISGTDTVHTTATMVVNFWPVEDFFI